MQNAGEIWSAWKQPFEWDDVTIEWLKNRPQIIKDMLLKFPPDCKVRSIEGKKLNTPQPGEIAILVSHFENELVSVIVPGKPMKAQCQMDWLEIVECRPGLTVEDVKKHLEL